MLCAFVTTSPPREAHVLRVLCPTSSVVPRDAPEFRENSPGVKNSQWLPLRRVLARGECIPMYRGSDPRGSDLVTEGFDGLSRI